ncbi:hypothetical protein Acr_00g0014740 [Actinidia rufa]|uniref:Uncharacterized protein n=1 Tax=Actinidia rufa TaxID=165716 RepID=A0A7J0DAE4_9ERIC|nr:hypothetical protein Acr_00g0014740 [Actinidia rufa]
MEISLSGGDNITPGDEGEFCGSSREDSIEYLGAIRWDVGRIARRAFLDIPDKSLGGRSKTRLRTSSLEAPNPIRTQDRSLSMLARVGTSVLVKKTRKKVATEDAGKKVTPQPPLKGVVIQEKCPREGDHSTEKGGLDSSKGKEAMPPPPPPKRFKSNKGATNATLRTSTVGTSSPGGDLGSGTLMMSDASVAQILLNGVIPPTDKEKVNQLSESCLPLLSPSGVKSIFTTSTSRWPGAKSATDIGKPNAVANLEAKVAKLTSKLAKAKGLTIEEFKSSEDFKVAVTNSAATYFSEGFKFYKRQFLHQFPNLGIDVANMEMDPGFIEEKEATKEGEKRGWHRGMPYRPITSGCILDIGNIFDGDQGALSFNNEWAYHDIDDIFDGDQGALIVQ